MENKNKLMNLLMSFGEEMISSGAEINRIEDSLSRIGQAFGVNSMNVLVITSTIIITMFFDDGSEITQTRRIYDSASTNFLKLEALNALSRKCCQGTVDISEFSYELDNIKKIKPASFLLYLGSILVSGAFAIFFGGTFSDGTAAAVFGIIICLMQRKIYSYCPNKAIFNLLCSLIAGFGICFTVRLFPGLNADKIMIGDIMLLIPGMALTNSVRDMIVGDTISGALRLCESLIWAGALACGFMIPIWIMGI